MLQIHDILVWIRIRIGIRVSMPLTNGSGCGSGSCYFSSLTLRFQQKNNFFKKFFCLLLFWRYIYQRYKVWKKSQSSSNQGFSYYFCLVIEGSGSGSRAGSIPLTNGSGSRRPKNMWIQWIGIRIRIRIRNTGKYAAKRASKKMIIKFCSIICFS